MKKPFIFLAALAGLALVVWGGWHYSQRGKDQGLVFHGNVDIRQISLAFDGYGRIKALNGQEGERVKTGALLGRLDTQTTALQAEQALAQIEVQRQSLLRLRNGARPQEIAQASSRLLARQADAARAEKDLARLQSVAANTQGRGVSAQDLDRAKSTVQMAQAQVAEQQQALRLIQEGPRKEEIAMAEAQLKASQAQLALLQHQIDLGELRSPADAVIRSRLLEPGDMATPQRPVFALALLQPKWVRIYVDETRLGRLRPGMEARVLTDSQPDQALAGKVGYISSVAEFTPKSVQTEELRTSLVYEVRVQIEDPRDLLRLGQPATVHLAADAVR